MAASEATVNQIKGVLRTELKLGDQAIIANDMPLIGGDYDLDSLDVLLLVTTIEKRFGFKIPDEAIGREAFATVEALAEFVEAHRSREVSS